uniref:Low-density lipoprotein receptor class A domain-containing protein n=2 Tax=Anoplophora glabripennis TaxID=217634 RepID=V5IAP0_ANOGL
MLSVVSAGAAAGMGGMDRLRGGRAARELAATRDRQVRLHAVHTDIAINLPHSIAMPDGEEHPFTSSRLHIRDAEQESEIYQKCIRPPPNRTVLESESPPPYRSSSAGVLASSSSSSSGSDWSAGSAPLVVRCHSMSSTSKPISSSSHPNATSQKTDFLQRTVKIFTGKKTQHHQPPPAPTLPVVVVPATSRSRRTDPSRPKPPPGV